MKRARSAVALLLGALLLACAPAYRGEPLYGPLPTSAELRLGQRVFDRHCHQCHPGGAAGLGPSLNDKPLPAGLIAFQVRHGVGAMPGFSEERISDDELAALLHYLETLRVHGL